MIKMNLTATYVNYADDENLDCLTRSASEKDDQWVTGQASTKCMSLQRFCDGSGSNHYLTVAALKRKEDDDMLKQGDEMHWRNR